MQTVWTTKNISNAVFTVLTILSLILLYNVHMNEKNRSEFLLSRYSCGHPLSPVRLASAEEEKSAMLQVHINSLRKFRPLCMLEWSKASLAEVEVNLKKSGLRLKFHSKNSTVFYDHGEPKYVSISPGAPIHILLPSHVSVLFLNIVLRRWINTKSDESYSAFCRVVFQPLFSYAVVARLSVDDRVKK